MKNNKYNAQKSIVDGIKFDSKKEAKRYQELKLLEREGAITELVLQPVFELIPTQKYKGETLRKVSYIADFQYRDKMRNLIVEDTKGFKTPDYIIKKKMFLMKYGNKLFFREL